MGKGRRAEAGEGGRGVGGKGGGGAAWKALWTTAAGTPDRPAGKGKDASFRCPAGRQDNGGPHLFVAGHGKDADPRTAFLAPSDPLTPPSSPLPHSPPATPAPKSPQPSPQKPSPPLAPLPPSPTLIHHVSPPTDSLPRFALLLRLHPRLALAVPSSRGWRRCGDENSDKQVEAFTQFFLGFFNADLTYQVSLWRDRIAGLCLRRPWRRRGGGRVSFHSGLPCTHSPIRIGAHAEARGPRVFPIRSRIFPSVSCLHSLRAIQCLPEWGQFGS